MALEIYALFDTNDCPKRLKSSGIDEFYYYFPPPLPSLIVLFMVTKDVEEVNYLFKVSVCIDNELEDKYIGEMGDDKLSICWNGDWTSEEATHAETVSKLGRVLKISVFKEDLPPPQEEEELEGEEEEGEEEEEEEEEYEEEITEEEKIFNEDELLKSSIQMLEEEFGQHEAATQKLNDDINCHIHELFKKNIKPPKEMNGTLDKKNKKLNNLQDTNKITGNNDLLLKTKVTAAKKKAQLSGEGRVTKKGSASEKKPAKKAPKKTAAKKAADEKTAKDVVEKTPEKKKVGRPPKPKLTIEKTPDKTLKMSIKKVKSPTSIVINPIVESDTSVDSFEFCDETERAPLPKIIAGRIGGKRNSPFAIIPKLTKKYCLDTERPEGEELQKSPVHPLFTSVLSFSDILPTRNPSRRWGHSFCPLNTGRALVIGGEGEKKVASADSIWILDTTSSTWQAQQTDNTSIGRRVGHTASYDASANVVYLFGGIKQDKWYSDVHVLEISTWKWTKCEAIGKAPTRAYHSCTMDFDELLIFGGVYPTPAPAPDMCSNELSIFSTENKSWYTPIVSGDIPCGRSGHTSCMLDRKLYIFGGWDAPTCFNDLYVLDLGIMNFVKQKTIGSVPKPRTWHASQLLTDQRRFCIYGGFNGERALDDLYIFHSVDSSWTKLFYPGLVCRAGHDVIPRITENENGEKLFVFGGGDNAGHFYNDLATLALG